MDEFERGFREELEKIAQGGIAEALGGAAQRVSEATRGHEALIGAGLGAVGGGVGGYYAGKKLTGTKGGGVGGAIAGAGVGALGGGLAGRAIGQGRAQAQGQEQLQALTGEHQRRATEEALMPETFGDQRFAQTFSAPEGVPVYGGGTQAEFAQMTAPQPRSMLPPGVGGAPGQEMIPPLGGGGLVPPEMQQQALSPLEAANLGMMGPVTDVAGGSQKVVGLTPGQKASRAQQAAQKKQLLSLAQQTLPSGGAGAFGGGPAPYLASLNE